MHNRFRIVLLSNCNNVYLTFKKHVLSYYFYSFTFIQSCHDYSIFRSIKLIKFRYCSAYNLWIELVLRSIFWLMGQTCSMISNYIPRHSPSWQMSVSEHSSFLPHVQTPLVQLSVLPEHFSFDPQLQTLWRKQVSESPEQSLLV